VTPPGHAASLARRRALSGPRRLNAIWHFQNGKVTEILTLQDQFAILKQTGYFPDSVHAA
jgi:hypothetical protein